MSKQAEQEFETACQHINVKDRKSFYWSILLGLNSTGALGL